MNAPVFSIGVLDKAIVKAKRRMSATEFDAVCPLLKISEDRIKAAHAAIVEGRTFQSIADEFGWTRQAVNNTVSDVWDVVVRYRKSQRVADNAAESLPAGWERVSLITPSYLIPIFRTAIAQAVSQPRNISKTAGDSENEE